MLFFILIDFQYSHWVGGGFLEDRLVLISTNFCNKVALPNEMSPKALGVNSNQ